MISRGLSFAAKSDKVTEGWLSRVNLLARHAKVPARVDRRERTRVRFANALDRGERIADGGSAFPAGRLEIGARRLHGWRQNLDIEAPRLIAEFGELVGVRFVERHRRREKFDRIIRFEIGCLIGDQRIGRGVAFVETVIGEFGEEVEDFIGLRFGKAAFGRAR